MLVSYFVFSKIIKFKDSYKKEKLVVLKMSYVGIFELKLNKTRSRIWKNIVKQKKLEIWDRKFIFWIVLVSFSWNLKKLLSYLTPIPSNCSKCEALCETRNFKITNKKTLFMYFYATVSKI